jgi:hypothetical protein
VGVPQLLDPLPGHTRAGAQLAQLLGDHMGLGAQLAG